MQWYEILIIVVACVFVVSVITWQIVRRKKGKNGCDCCGGNCSSCCGCSHSPKEDKKN